MESAKLLDILGNENRRRILQLLASRPFYVSEIAERISVGPKAVLGHLEMLEQTGLIQGKTNEQRRKYYQILENVKLEVFVSPYSYKVETSSLLIHQPSEQKRVQTEDDKQGSDSTRILKQLNRRLFALESSRRRLADEQRNIESQMTDVLEKSIQSIYEVAQDYLEAEILQTLFQTPGDRRMLSMHLRLPEYMIEKSIQSLIDRKVIHEKKMSNDRILTLVESEN